MSPGTYCAPEPPSAASVLAAHAAHDERVRRIAAEVRARAARRAAGTAPPGEFASLGKAAVSHFVPNPHDPRHDDRKIDVRDLRAIIELDVSRRICIAEPGVTFAELVEATLPHGLVPMLVPELKTITIGGAVSGCSVESMSFRYGGFHDSCLEYEVITGTGDVIVCSREREPLVFEMVHGSYGTLGIIARLRFRLIPAKPFVHMTYRAHGTFAEFRADLVERCRRGDHDFVDGIIHARDCFVLCLGRFVDVAPYTSRYWLNPFFPSTRTRREDYLATADYFFRYDADCHWLTRTVPIPFLTTVPVRLLAGRWFLGSTNLLSWAKRLRPLFKRQKSRPPIVLDVFIPRRRMDEFWAWAERELDYYPVWVVPYGLPETGPYPWVSREHAARLGDNLMIDFAFYGKDNNDPGRDYAKMLEDKTYELGGIKTLISANDYDPATFWSIYDRANYETVKARTDPYNLFRNLYDKFHFHRLADARRASSLPAGAAP